MPDETVTAGDLDWLRERLEDIAEATREETEEFRAANDAYVAAYDRAPLAERIKHELGLPKRHAKRASMPIGAGTRRGLRPPEPLARPPFTPGDRDRSTQ